MKLMKSKKGGENYAVFYFAGKRFFIYIYEVFTWGKQTKPLVYTTGMVLVAYAGPESPAAARVASSSWASPRSLLLHSISPPYSSFAPPVLLFLLLRPSLSSSLNLKKREPLRSQGP
jgi:hypothetical protein